MLEASNFETEKKDLDKIVIGIEALISRVNDKFETGIIREYLELTRAQIDVAFRYAERDFQLTMRCLDKENQQQIMRTKIVEMRIFSYHRILSALKRNLEAKTR